MKLQPPVELDDPEEVAPHAGAWIETRSRRRSSRDARSPPMRGRGLKPVMPPSFVWVAVVAPHAGAWIETPSSVRIRDMGRGRPPCGGVD